MLNNIVNPKAMSKKENKEQDILKAAEMLFAEKGFVQLDSKLPS